MKKLLTLALALCMLLALAACGSGTTPTATPTTNTDTTPSTEPTDDGTEPEDPPVDAEGTFEIALITDFGGIDDKSFNEGAWNGLENYAKANNISYAYYHPFEDTATARMDNINTAVSKGAKIIICPGYLFADAVCEAQTIYPDVQFLLLDTEPSADGATVSAEANTHSILYKDEQAGFLAGYAAVMDGYRSLGYLGGMDMPPVVRFGYGYIQGAELAAKELELAAGDVQINYWYSDTFAPSDDITTKMNSWYFSGTEVVFSCGGGIYLSCITAADANDGKIIGVDSDQAAESDTIITSAMKNLTNSVELALAAIYENGGTWDASRAGQTAVLGIDEDCVGLPTAAESWRFETYSTADYETLRQRIIDGEIEISNSHTEQPAVEIVTVDYQS